VGLETADESLRGMTRSNVSGQGVPSLWCCDRECLSSKFSVRTLGTVSSGASEPRQLDIIKIPDQVVEV